jgi:hypothetical protein
MLSATEILDFPEIELVYSRFAALTLICAEPGGLLLLYAGLDGDGIATAMAANVAGVASLGVERDAARCRQALRAGVCDFVVNSLDEALRILKNEVRQRRAASVVVTGDVDTMVREIIARGVQPDVLGIAVPELVERGAKLIAMDGKKAKDACRAVVWSVAHEPVRWLPALDRLAADSLEESKAGIDGRVRWLAAAPRYLGRMFAGQRYLRMTDAEVARFTDAVETAVRSGALPVGAVLTVDGQTTRIEKT